MFWQETRRVDKATDVGQEELCKQAAKAVRDNGHAASEVQLESLMSSLWCSRDNNIAQLVDLALAEH